jgi:hypothetical protein
MRVTRAAAAFIAVLSVCAPSASAAVRRLPTGPVVHAAAATPPSVVLKRVKKAFQKPAPAGSRPDVSPLMRRLALALPQLHGAERRQAASLLARPTQGSSDPDGGGWTAPEAGNSPLCSAHYCVHWVDQGNDAPPLGDSNGNGIPDWVETVSQTAENVYSFENGTLGWRAPKGDGTRGGGSNLTDIYLADVGGSGLYGYSAPDPQPDGNRLFAYLVLDNDFSPSQFTQYSTPVDPLDVTLAHEYNHVLQFGYDANEDTWMLESTAVWMEGKAYQPVHDYLQYLPGWVELSQQPITSFDGNNPNDRNNVKVYGSAVWNKWLDQRYGQDVVRGAWEDSVQAGSFGPGAYDAAIRQHGGVGFGAEFDLFAAATAEWQAANSGFPEGAAYPDVNRAGQLPVNGAPGTIPLDHTAYALVKVPVVSAPQIRLGMSAPSGTRAALALVGRTGGLPGGTLVEAVKRLPNGGYGQVTLTNPGNLTRLTAVLINSDVKHGAYSQALQDYPFKRDAQNFYAHTSTDFTPPHVSTHSASAKKVTVKFSEPVLGVSKSSFKITGASGRVNFQTGDRKATLVPSHALRRGRHHVTLSSAIADLTLNRLPAGGFSFTVR